MRDAASGIHTAVTGIPRGHARAGPAPPESDGVLGEARGDSARFRARHGIADDESVLLYYWSCGLMFRQDMLTQNRAGMNVLEKLGTWGVLRTMQSFNKITGYNDDHIKKIFERNMGVTMGNGKWRAVPRHLCHVASTFYDSPHEEALCVTLDDSGECSTQEDMAGIPLVTPSRRRR